MPVKVVDASAVAAVLFGEPEAERIVERIDGFALAAPRLLQFEIASVCLKKIRLHPGNRSAILSAFSLLSEMAIEPADVSPAEVVLLAERTKLTAYDAAYVWLARALGADLISLDEKLLRAARAH